MMKRFYSLLLVITASTLLFGCDNKISNDGTGAPSDIANESLQNLDTNDTKITIYEPDSGKWTVLRYHTIDIAKDALTRIPEMVKYFGKDFYPDKAYFLVHTPIKDETGNYTRRYGFGDCPNGDGFYAQYVMYEGGDLRLQYNIGGMMEVSYPDEARKLAEVYEPFYGNFYDIGSLYKTINLEDSPEGYDTSFCIGNNEQSIRVAAERLRNYLYDCKLNGLNPGFFSVSEDKVEVYRYNDDKYGYFFSYSVKYDGVPLNKPLSCGFPKTDYIKADPQKYPLIKTILDMEYRIGTYSDDGCDYIESPSFTFFTSNSPEKKTLETVISYHDACAVISEFLSADNVFKVESATLQYALVAEIENTTNYVSDYDQVLEPVWIFTITHVDDPNIATLYAMVIAETGELLLGYTRV